MPRYRLLIEYDGRPFHGFQAQADLMLGQMQLNEAIDQDELLAGVLGITVEELQTARDTTVGQAIDALRASGHALIANKSVWRSFPTVRCRSWSAGVSRRRRGR